MLKFVTEEQFEKLKHSALKNTEVECVESCNKNNCVTENTCIIIVGTITPPEGAGYFYTAPRNKIYGYIDQAIGTQLKYKKKLLLEKCGDKEIINQIKQELVQNNIAFLDVISKAVRKKDSPYDADIKFCTLDYNVFKNNTNALYICNSLDAERGMIEICKTLNIELKHIYLSQRKATKAEWLNAIRKKLIIN